MKNEIYLETCTSKEDYIKTGVLNLPLESLITYVVYTYCQCKEIKLNFVYTNTCTVNSSLYIINNFLNFTDDTEIPWQVKSCVYPVVLFEDTILTGLCAVSRHMCKCRQSKQSTKEHEDGLLGFRKSCLQAPNEVSIWTKFCEVDLITTVKNLLYDEVISKVPISLVRFENHLNKPVRIHNVYKVARNIRKQNNESSNINEYKANMAKRNIHNMNENSQQDNIRVPKSRKWKSNNRKKLEVNCSLRQEDLNISHQFAEGPFFTLADLVLLPLYHIVIQVFGENEFQILLPLTYNWYLNVKNINEVRSLNEILKTIKVKSLSIQNMKLPEVDDVSLYKSDPKRHNPKKRLFTKPEDIDNALKVLVDGMELNLNNIEYEKALDWNIIPEGANPAAGHLPDERVIRKSQQLENLCLAVLAIAQKGNYIVDFCSGSGHLGILVAYLLPKCTVILLENKEQSLLRARDRVHKMGLKNVYFFQCNLDFFIGKFDIGIALHACGIASDLVLDKCLKANAKFVICPCCYGSLHATDRLVYPRSAKFEKMSVEQYLCIGHTADQTHKEHPLAVRGARCMAIIDSDRARLAEEFGYTVTLSRLKPLSCTPKNNLLVGVPL